VSGALHKHGKAPDHHYTCRSPAGNSWQIHPHGKLWKVLRTIQEKGDPRYRLVASIEEARALIRADRT
jgi:hypothetical protein